LVDASGGRGRDPRIAIGLRDLASLKREKTIVLALLIQLFVAAFSSFLVVGLTSLYDPGSVGDAEIAVGVSGEVREDLLEATRQHDGVEGVQFATPGEALTAFDDGRVQAVLLGRSVSTDTGTRIEVEAIAPAENLRTTMVVVQLRRVLSTLEDRERAERAASLSYRPIDPPARTDGSPYYGFTYTILVPLLVFLPPFISGSITVDAITEELEQGTLELLRVAPVSLTDVVDGKAAGMILLAPVQVVLWIALLAVNGISVDNPLALLVLVSAVTTVVVAVGVLLGLVMRTRQQAQLLYSTLVLALFGLAALLPEHPATTVARLAVGSGTTGTIAHVGFFAAVAVAVALGTRRYVGGIDPGTLD